MGSHSLKYRFPYEHRRETALTVVSAWENDPLVTTGTTTRLMKSSGYRKHAGKKQIMRRVVEPKIPFAVIIKIARGKL